MQWKQAMKVRLKRQTPARSGYPDDARVGAGFHLKPACLGEKACLQRPVLGFDLEPRYGHEDDGVERSQFTDWRITKAILGHRHRRACQ